MEDRKSDHIELALKSQISAALNDNRFLYEPLLGVSVPAPFPEIRFMDKTLKIPMWVSSMTGGTQQAGNINRNLARACNEFGMGMGLGSCRILLENRSHFADFNVRDLLGKELPLFANLGVAQVEQMLRLNSLDEVFRLLADLDADGLIIHVNPIQEWLQREGDEISVPPVDTITEFLEKTNLKIIVKEVGQGMGPASLEALLKLPIGAIEFAAFGGTNFAQIEISRSSAAGQDDFSGLSLAGHTAAEMLTWTNQIVESGKPVKCRQLIISGGVRNFLDGHYFLSWSKLPAIYGQASGFLKHATQDYTVLRRYVSAQVEGLMFARNYLHIRDNQ